MSKENKETPIVHDLEIDESEFRYAARAITSNYDMHKCEARISDYMENFINMKRSHYSHMVDSLEVSGLASARAEALALEDVIVAILVAVMFAVKSGRAKLEHEMETACCEARRRIKQKAEGRNDND